MASNKNTVTVWNSKAFYRGENPEEKITYGYCTPDFTDLNDRAEHDHGAPITYTLNLKDDYDPTYSYGLRWVFSLPTETTPLIQPLKLLRLKLKTRDDHGITEKRLFCYVYHARAKTRYATQKNIVAPNIETYPFAENLTYRFYYRCSFTGYRRVKIVKSTKHNNPPTHPRVKFADNMLQTHTEKMILEKLTATDNDGLTLILFKLEYRDQFDLPSPTETIRATRTHHKKRVTIDYERLMRYEKRISKKWFAKLLEVLQTDNPNLNTLPKHLRKVAKKVITYSDINPTLKTVNRKKTPNPPTTQNH